MSSRVRSVVVAAIVVAVVLVGVVVGMKVWGPDDGADSGVSPTAVPTTPQVDPETPATPTPEPTTLAPEAALTEQRDIGKGATVQIVKIESVQSQAEIPGEISAPALRVTVTVRGGTAPVNLGAVLVNAYYGKDRTPAIEIARPGGQPFSGTLAPKKSATGVYVFNVPTSERQNVTIEVIHPDSTKSLYFQGAVS